MSYSFFEKSPFSGKPVELYRFAMGSSLWLYTNTSDEVQYNGEKYKPTYITREGFVKSGDISKSSVTQIYIKIKFRLFLFPSHDRFALNLGCGPSLYIYSFSEANMKLLDCLI